MQAGYTWLAYDQGRFRRLPCSALCRSAWTVGVHGLVVRGRRPTRCDVYAQRCSSRAVRLIGPEPGRFPYFYQRLEQTSRLEHPRREPGRGVINGLAHPSRCSPTPRYSKRSSKGHRCHRVLAPERRRSPWLRPVAKRSYLSRLASDPHGRASGCECGYLARPARRRNGDRHRMHGGRGPNLAKSEAKQGPVPAGFSAKGVTAVRLAESILRDLARVTDNIMADTRPRRSTSSAASCHERSSPRASSPPDSPVSPPIRRRCAASAGRVDRTLLDLPFGPSGIVTTIRMVTLILGFFLDRISS